MNTKQQRHLKNSNILVIAFHSVKTTMVITVTGYTNVE